MFGKKREHGEMVPAEAFRTMSPFEDFERWFEDVLGSPLSRKGLTKKWFGEELFPVADIFDDGANLVLKAELPGMAKEDIDVKLIDNVVTISGERKREEKVEEKDYYRVERSSGSFLRSFRLPVEVKQEEIAATFKDGVLEVKLPKTEEAKNREFKVTVH